MHLQFSNLQIRKKTKGHKKIDNPRTLSRRFPSPLKNGTKCSLNKSADESEKTGTDFRVDKKITKKRMQERFYHMLIL